MTAATLLGVAAALAVSSPAEARRKHARPGRHHHAAAGGGYNPPFAAMVVDANTGRTMYAVDENAPRHPASITKVMTLYLLFEQLEKGNLALDSDLRISAHAAAQAPSKLGLRPGETITAEEAIKAIVTKSANDVAAAIAENVAGSEEGFAERMTRKARALGMNGTLYRNASGLPNPEQITTARDLTILARAIQTRFPRYYKYFNTRTFAFKGRVIGNHNRLVGKVEGVDGIKTGFTNASGFNLMTSARLDGRHVVGVVLGGKSAASRDAIMTSLIRTNLARGSTSVTATRVADAGDDIETTASTGVDRTAAVRPLDVATGRRASSTPVSYASAASDDAAPLPPVSGRKLEARMPATVVVPVSVEPPVRVAALARPERDEDARETARPARISPWVIQLGASEDEKDARAILADARSKSGRLLANAAPFTEKVQRSGATLFRARFSGFAEADSAQDACRSLKRSGFACFATRS